MAKKFKAGMQDDAGQKVFVITVSDAMQADMDTVTERLKDGGTAHSIAERKAAFKSIVAAAQRWCESADTDRETDLTAKKTVIDSQLDLYDPTNTDFEDDNDTTIVDNSSSSSSG